VKRIQPHAKSLVIALVLTAPRASFRAWPAPKPMLPRPLLPDSFHWLSPSENPALSYAWVLGNGNEPGPCILHVKLSVGGRIPPHTQPDEPHVTVLAGTVHLGFGESFDESKLIALPAGAVCVPSNVPHYGWARDGEAIYQEAGVGVTGASFVHPPDEQAERPNYFFFATPYKSSSSIPV
jgi:hypothetical protein